MPNNHQISFQQPEYFTTVGPDSHSGRPSRNLMNPVAIVTKSADKMVYGQEEESKGGLNSLSNVDDHEESEDDDNKLWQVSRDENVIDLKDRAKRGCIQQ